jgi:hypothetical protein
MKNAVPRPIMTISKHPAYLVWAVTVVLLFGGCGPSVPPIRFAPPGTDLAKLRAEFPLTDAERQALTPEGFKALTQEQIDQIYLRLSSGPMPDGPFRGDLFFPRDRDGHARIRDLTDPNPAPLVSHIAALRAERLGRLFWKGKVFFRSQGVLRNRIEQLVLLRPFIEDADNIPKLTFDGETTWLLFPALISCGESRLDKTRPSVIVDYARGSEVEGFRPVPDKLAGPEGLNIRDEVRIIRPGFYLGRAYFGQRFSLNFTLIDPAVAGGQQTTVTQENCDGSDRLSPRGGDDPRAFNRRLWEAERAHTRDR